MMPAKKLLVRISMFLGLCLCAPFSFAQADEEVLGQTIQIYTRFHSFIGKPIWTLIIRDIDHNQNIPYLFDIRKGGNHWVAFTFGRNYLITVSRLQIETYRSRYNKFKNYRINDFCNLESNGRIIRGRSMYITIDGDLSPYSNTYTCHVSSYPDENFYIYNPDSTS
ncbi:hypothetical protein AQUSIP_22290 [Aquicella siphonis]|uniref:Uncharacterized protein n=1 Tax=Aquicella siphonis TaxID=254247 RepID=A0A5E4PKX6_9COXI|nr:hypothetical protein [Aquicella siphonis]VVC76902.1 hypothetical protein AQUSIP_22290 [Aquicella siphonis]